MIAQPEAMSAEDRAFLLAFVDDTDDLEESPWMVASDLRRLVVDAFRFPLQHHAARHHPEWYLSSDLPVLFPKPDGGTGQVAPDVLVARAPSRLRDSFNSAAEGGFPAFVLEVVSPDSSRRDEEDKARLYGLLGAEEYAIFNPRARRKPRLQGYHRVAGGARVPWPLVQEGELHSRVLGLALVVDGQYLRLQDAQGNRILSAAEEAEQAHRAAEERVRALLREAEQARRAAEQRERVLRQELEARLAAVEEELARLRQRDG